jgi:PadR family transcriptional regulator AphA
VSSDVRLGPVSYVVLGIVALRGPSTPYELKQFVERTLGYFWPFPHTQLYTEPARLADAGLLDEAREDGGRRRRHYTITDGGRAALSEWLAVPATAPSEIRDSGLLKLFFGELGEPEQMLALAHAQAAAQRELLARYQAIHERYRDRPEYAHRVITVELGIAYARAAIAFWESVATRQAAPKPRRRATRSG